MIWWKISDPQFATEYDVFEAVTNLPFILRAFEREEAAKAVEAYAKNRQTLLDELGELGAAYQELIKAAEKVASSDWNIEKVDEALAKLEKSNVDGHDAD